jgi:hypothetical protein
MNLQRLLGLTKVTLIYLIMGSVSTQSNAQIFEEVSPLNLGRVAVIKNDTQGTLTVDRFDNVSYSEHFRIILPGLAGVYRLSGAPPNTGFFFSASARSASFSANLGVETFIIESLHYDNYDVSDDLGNLYLKIGATIRTSGNGPLIYSDAPYSTIIDVTYNF